MIEIYTDGSCSGNGEEENFGGFGLVVVKNDEVLLQYKKGLKNTTNNRAELYGVINGIVIAKKLRETYTKEIIIHTDSAYVQQMVTRWMYNWEKKGWRKGDGKTPENIDLVKALFSLMQFERAIRVEKIKGHDGHKYNEMADDLATEATKEAKEMGSDADGLQG